MTARVRENLLHNFNIIPKGSQKEAKTFTITSFYSLPIKIKPNNFYCEEKKNCGRKI